LAVTDIVGLENLQREYAGFQKILTEKSGIAVELFPVPNRTAAVEALNAKKVDLVLTGPAEYVVFKKRTDAKLVVGFSRPEYYGSVVTMLGSGIDGVEDLKGKKVGLGDVGSTSRHLSPIQLLADLGLQPGGYFQVALVQHEEGGPTCPTCCLQIYCCFCLSTLILNLLHMHPPCLGRPPGPAAGLGRGSGRSFLLPDVSSGEGFTCAAANPAESATTLLMAFFLHNVA
jgi:hypothetical protein